MNKLLVSDIIDIKKGEYYFKCQTNDLVINVTDVVTIYLFNENLAKLDINLNKGSSLKIYLFNNSIQSNLEVNINQSDDSKLYYNAAFINTSDVLYKINNYIKGNNNISNINIRNISNSGNSRIIINVDVLSNTKDNIALEDLKGINNGGTVHIEPNIIVLSNEVMANHLTTIGSVDKNALEYLMSKGLEYEGAKEILLKGFIYSNMDNKIGENFGGD